MIDLLIIMYDIKIQLIIWINDRSVNYTYIAYLDIMLLKKGNKNVQNKDIKKAKDIVRKDLNV